MIKNLPCLLSAGGHHKPADGLCVLEAVAYISGLPHSDCPECVHATLAHIAMTLNDESWSDDEARTEAMGPLVAKLIGTATRDKRKIGEVGLRLVISQLLPMAYPQFDAARTARLGLATVCAEIAAIPENKFDFDDCQYTDNLSRLRVACRHFVAGEFQPLATILNQVISTLSDQARKVVGTSHHDAFFEATAQVLSDLCDQTA